MKQPPDKDPQAGYTRRFLSPIRRVVARGVAVESLARETSRLLRKSVPKSTVHRWLTVKGKAVEPKVGAALALQQASLKLSRRAK